MFSFDDVIMVPGKWQYIPWQIDGLVPERRNSSALAMGLRLSCTNPPINMRTWLTRSRETPFYNQHTKNELQIISMLMECTLYNLRWWQLIFHLGRTNVIVVSFKIVRYNRTWLFQLYNMFRRPYSSGKWSLVNQQNYSFGRYKIQSPSWLKSLVLIWSRLLLFDMFNGILLIM